ncbi:Wzz/FepE/Etk N-terminal domain-containing protein [Solibacillus sp. CAU 1738]|uniref:YveK family protein n=1 Tax=Solibacillus sp. CAU 1738 TaxID=3140363 RepID=UPI00326120DA
MEETISLREILTIIKKRLLLILTLIIISIGIASYLNFYVLTPIYEAQTQILVNQKPSSQEGYSWNQMETDLQLINTYNVIITSSAILNKVIEELELDMTSDQLMKKISVSNENDSKVVNIKVEYPNPEQAVSIANTIAVIFKVEIPPLLSVDNINILSEAKLSENPTPIKPRKLINIATAAIIGLMVGAGLALLIEVLDTTIKSERDIEEILELPIMGLVGSISLDKEKKSSFKFRRQRGK